MYDSLLSRKGLSIERLHALVLLSEHGSLIKAAKNDFGVQSRYSHYLRELSGFIGTRLTRKDGRSIRLTPAGEDLASLARSHFRELLEFQSKASGSVQQVVVGAGDSLLQWLLIPTIGKMRALGRKTNVKVVNLRTDDLVLQLKEQRLDFALIRQNAVTKPLHSKRVCVVKYVVVVPRRLVPRRLTLKSALLECPHATLGGDGELVQRLRTLAEDCEGIFRPELVCESAGQCMAAVRTGSYAAVVPTQVVESNPNLDCVVVDDEALADLDRPVALAWSPRNLESLGEGIQNVRDGLLNALTEEAQQRGMIKREQ
ncbi:MAG: LysR family transcriptional regulator [Opitutaceae bacterium]|nr:LysR family transcriptional regulator [Opitutaceae bacterium]